MNYQIDYSSEIPITSNVIKIPIFKKITGNYEISLKEFNYQKDCMIYLEKQPLAQIKNEIIIPFPIQYTLNNNIEISFDREITFRAVTISLICHCNDGPFHTLEIKQTPTKTKTCIDYDGLLKPLMSDSRNTRFCFPNILDIADRSVRIGLHSLNLRIKENWSITLDRTYTNKTPITSVDELVDFLSDYVSVDCIFQNYLKISNHTRYNCVFGDTSKFYGLDSIKLGCSQNMWFHPFIRVQDQYGVNLYNINTPLIYKDFRLIKKYDLESNVFELMFYNIRTESYLEADNLHESATIRVSMYYVDPDPVHIYVSIKPNLILSK